MYSKTNIKRYTILKLINIITTFNYITTSITTFMFLRRYSSERFKDLFEKSEVNIKGISMEY